jgi:hypothetical protein
MDQQGSTGAVTAFPSLSSPGRLLLFAVLVPAAVAVSNQVLLDAIGTRQVLAPWLYPWIVTSTAALSWCTGRYLGPAWLRLIIFGWCLALLDLLTFIACLTHRVDYQFGYVLVSAQIGLLILWAISGPGSWQMRLPSVAIVTPVVLVFCGSFVGSSYMARSWNVMMFITSPVVAALCGGLRYLGFMLRESSSTDSGKRPSYQFGMKHMLIWLTVTGPLLLFVRSLDIGGRGLYPAALLAAGVATVNLIAIWAVLGGGNWIIRLASLIGVPFLIADGMNHYSAYLKFASVSPNLPAVRWSGTIVWALVEMKGLWTASLWLDAALLAALLLFFRASGYRLIRKIS